MAQPLPNGRRPVVTSGRVQQATVHQLCNQMDDDSSSCYDRADGSLMAATTRGVAADERFGAADFSSMHESRPNNLVI